jgi:hypothetical protein
VEIDLERKIAVKKDENAAYSTDSITKSNAKTQV